MADQLVDRILDSARSRLPGAMDPQILFELADVLNEFFRMSTCWRETITLNFDAVELDYELFTDDMPARVITLLGVYDSSDVRVEATIVDGNTLRLRREVTAGAYTVWTVLTVTNRINNEKYPRFPQWVSDTYGDVIADGIVGRMAAQPAKPFSSPKHALFYSQKFKQGVQSARIETNKQHLYAGQPWRFPRFAAQNNPQR